MLLPQRPFGDFFGGVDVAAGAEDVRVLVAVARVDVVMVRVELATGTGEIETDSEEVHLPRSGLQPAPQYSAPEPHQPYLMGCQLRTFGDERRK